MKIYAVYIQNGVFLAADTVDVSEASHVFASIA